MEALRAFSKLRRLVGKDLLSVADEHQVTVHKPGKNGDWKYNKGWAGHAVERYLGIPLNSGRAPNLGSWELKVIPLRRGPDGRLVPKETMAITMIDEQEVLRQEFRNSHLHTKLNKLVIVARLSEPGPDKQEHSSLVLCCTSFHLSDSCHRDQIKADYDSIRGCIRDGEALKGEMGMYIQPRTKGAKGSASRAFYARKNLVEHMVGSPPIGEEPVFSQHAAEIVPTDLDLPRPADCGPRSDCPLHSGQKNEGKRRGLDQLMHSLPRNQSGAGRHKCVYCAYQLGFRAGLHSRLKGSQLL